MTSFNKRPGYRLPTGPLAGCSCVKAAKLLLKLIVMPAEGRRGISVEEKTGGRGARRQVPGEEPGPRGSRGSSAERRRGARHPLVAGLIRKRPPASCWFASCAPSEIPVRRIQPFILTSKPGASKMAQPGSPTWDRILGSEPHTRQAARPQSRPGFGADARTEPDWIPIPHDLSP